KPATRLEFRNTPENGPRRRNIVESQNVANCDEIDMIEKFQGSEGFHGRRHNQDTFAEGPTERFDPEPIASCKGARMNTVPDDKSEHAIELFDHFGAPSAIALDNDFGIGVRMED